MNGLVEDVRFAIRQLWRSPGFTLTAVLTLSLGLGVSAAVSSVIQTVLLTALPYTEANKIVGLALTFPEEKPNAEQTGAAADFLRDNMQEFSSIAVMDDGSTKINLSLDGGHAAQVSSLRVSQGYFQTLDVHPVLGRVFTPAEDRPGGGRTAILSHSLWKRVFNGDANIVGRAIRVNQETYTVVGVMAADFAVTAQTTEDTFGSPDLWTPLQLSPKDPGYDGDNYQMIARLNAGVTLGQVQHHLTALEQPFYQKVPGYREWFDNGRHLHQFKVWTLQEVLVGRVRHSLLTVMGAVAAVLLVACLNLAGLMLARSLRRSREFAVRSALGATRGQLVRLLFCEGLLLAFAGAIVGTAVTRASTHLLLHASPLPIPTAQHEPTVLVQSVLTFAAALIAVTLFCLVPSLIILRGSGRAYSLGSGSVGETASHARLSRSLIVTQIAVSMVLLSTASMLLGTFLKLRSIPSGVEPRQLEVFQVALKGDAYANTRHTTQFVNSVLDELSHQPGVDRVAAINGLPLDHGLNIGGYPTGHPDLRHVIEFRTITPGYFSTMGIPLLAGRDINDSDRAGSDPVVIIGATAARRYWPGRSPLGELFRVGNETNWRIVGVAADTHEHSLVSAEDIVIYAPMAQLTNEFTGIVNNWFPTTFAMRTAAHIDLAAAASRAVEHADSQIPVARFTTMQAVIDATMQEPRFYSLLAGGFSSFALALTSIGLFALLSYQVSQRTREIGLRMAVGADRAQILRVFLAHGLTMVTAGVLIGVVVAWLVRPVLTHLIADSGIQINSAKSLMMNSSLAALLAAAAIFIAALAASWLPAQRASSIEPMEALRTE